MDPRMLSKGEEYNHDGNGGVARPNEPGVYFHPGSNKFVETFGVKRPDGEIVYAQEQGKIQGDAFTQIGYRQATDVELKEYRAQQAAAEKAKQVKATATTTVMSSPPRN